MNKNYFDRVHVDSVWKDCDGTRWLVLSKYQKFNENYFTLIDKNAHKITEVKEELISNYMTLLGVYDDFWDAVESHTFRGDN